MLTVLFQKIDENYARKICSIKVYPLLSKLRLVDGIEPISILVQQCLKCYDPLFNVC